MSLCGCYAPPVVAYSGAAIDSLTDGIWSENLPEDILAPGRRVAILECSVEFVTMKYVTPTSRQALVGGPYMAISAVIDLSGIYRMRVDYPREVTRSIPRDVYASLVAALQSQGMTVVDPAHTVQTRPYRRLDRSTVQFSSPVQYIDPRGSDAGRPNRLETYPAWPLRVICEQSHAVLGAAESAIRTELQADVSLRLRLRVGVYKGRAALERGSVLHITDNESRHQVVAQRSVLSDRIVATHDEYEIISGRAQLVNWELFTDAIQRITPMYLAEALPDAAPVRIIADRRNR